VEARAAAQAEHLNALRGCNKWALQGLLGAGAGAGRGALASTTSLRIVQRRIQQQGCIRATFRPWDGAARRAIQVRASRTVDG